MGNEDTRHYFLPLRAISPLADADADAAACYDFSAISVATWRYLRLIIFFAIPLPRFCRLSRHC